MNPEMLAKPPPSQVIVVAFNEVLSYTTSESKLLSLLEVMDANGGEFSQGYLTFSHSRDVRPELQERSVVSSIAARLLGMGTPTWMTLAVQLGTKVGVYHCSSCSPSASFD